MKTTFKVAAAIAVASVLLTPLALDAANTNKTQSAVMASASQQEAVAEKIAAQGISKNAVETALKAYYWAIKQGQVKDKSHLTIVDFSLPSNKDRLFVVDMNTYKVIMKEHTSQGAGSGRGTMATHFSDKNGSHASVLGAMVTSNEYTGKHGKSLRLKGLEAINKNVMQRAIVIHPAKYVTDEFIHEYHRAGNSWGCFAVSPEVSKELINTIKGGSLLFAYAPQLADAKNYA